MREQKEHGDPERGTLGEHQCNCADRKAAATAREDTEREEGDAPRRNGHGTEHGSAEGKGPGGRPQGVWSAGGDDMGYLRILGGPVGMGALVATGVMLLASNRDKLKPAISGGMKEYYRFSDWLTSNAVKIKEDLSDVAAEARHEYEQELQRHLDLLEKEREMVQRLANLAKKRSEEA